MPPFREDSRVKIHSILHLTRLGYSYLPLWDHSRVAETNIFPAVFRSSLARIIIEQLMTAHQLPLTAKGCQFISNLVLKEYFAEFHRQQPA